MGKSGRSRRQAIREMRRLEQKRENSRIRSSLRKAEQRLSSAAESEEAQFTAEDKIPQPQTNAAMWTEYEDSDDIVNNYHIWKGTGRYLDDKQLHICVCLSCNAVRLLTKEMAKTAVCHNCMQNVDVLHKATNRAHDSLIEKFARGIGRTTTEAPSKPETKQEPKPEKKPEKKPEPRPAGKRVLLKRRKPIMVVTKTNEVMYFTTAEEAAKNAIPGKKLDESAIRNACLGRSSDAYEMLWSYATITAEEVIKWQKSKGLYIAK